MAIRPARKKNTPSTIKRLDPEIVSLIGDLRGRGRTIDEILAKLAELNVEVSRSALGRHVRDLHDVSAEMRDVQMYANALAKEVGDSSQSQMLDLNAQLLQANMFKLMLAAKDGEGIQLGPKDAKDFADALRSIALTRKTDLDLIDKAEKRAAEKAKLAAAESVTKAARAKGLSRDTVEAIRHAVLGSEG